MRDNIDQTSETSKEIAVQTINGDEIRLEVLPSSLVSDVKKLACECFGHKIAGACLSQGHELLKDSQILRDVICDSSSTLTLVIKSMVEVRRRVWMVPTLGYKGGGKGLPDELLKDDTVLLEPDLPVGDQITRLLAFDPEDVDLDEIVRSYEEKKTAERHMSEMGQVRAMIQKLTEKNHQRNDGKDESPPSSGKRSGTGLPQEKSSEAPLSVPEKGSGKGKGKSFDVNATGCFLVPLGRSPETETRTQLSVPPRPRIQPSDVRARSCVEIAVETFRDGGREVVILTPAYWWCPHRASEGPHVLLGMMPPRGTSPAKGKPKAPPGKGAGSYSSVAETDVPQKPVQVKGTPPPPPGKHKGSGKGTGYDREAFQAAPTKYEVKEAEVAAEVPASEPVEIE